MTGVEVFQRKATLVFAADQLPFVSSASGKPNWFCVLRPLMTLEGEAVDPSTMSFPNRGRVWWLLRDKIPLEDVLPGTVWTSTIELAQKYTESDPESDMFQARIHEMTFGGHDLVEIIEFDEDDPDIRHIHAAKPLPLKRPPLPRVWIRGQRWVIGPLKASWQQGRRSAVLAPTSTTTPEILRLPRSDFDRLASPRRFSFDSSEFNSGAERVPICVSLTRMAWLPMEKLRAAGEALDASTDVQVINWAARQTGVVQSQAAVLKEFVAKVEDKLQGDQESCTRLEHLRRLVTDAERVTSLGEEAARLLASQPAFHQLVESHIGQLTAERVAAEVATRQAQIDAQLQVGNQRLAAIQADLDKLSSEYNRRLEENEKALAKKMAEKIAAIEQREKDVQAREKAVREQETGLAARLERVIGRYQEQSERVGDDLLTLVPVLRRLGVGGVARATDGREEPAATELPLPAFLQQQVQMPNAAPLSEAEFFQQFEKTVAHAGFIFHSADLINFHVCMKIGGLTILAGQSGTGKSSLPRLYAKALGQSDEYLHIPVRPDWLDDRDFLGAFNPLSQRFEPAACGVVDRLIAANIDASRNRGGIYLVCLDEMNLARVEHYFAQFLSVMEQPLEDRTVNLFAEGNERPGDPYRAHRRLRLGDNVRFVGTVNIDETTHFFSPKVLDRAQVVSFSAPNLVAACAATPSAVTGSGLAVSYETFRSWMPDSATVYTPALLLEVNQLLIKSRAGLAFRQLRRIAAYVAAARPFLDEDRALDFQMAQVVLPRLRRTARGFENTRRSLQNMLPTSRFPRTGRLLELLEGADLEDDFFQYL